MMIGPRTRSRNCGRWRKCCIRIAFRNGNFDLQIAKYLTSAELERFKGLAAYRNFHPRPTKRSTNPPPSWTANLEEELKALEAKILRPSQAKVQRLAQKRVKLEKRDAIMYARVRVKSTGERGTGGIGYQWPTAANGFQYKILRDDLEEREDVFIFCNDREDLDMMCYVCDNVAAMQGRCAKCRLVWYCGRECQKTHWNVHKKLCGKNMPQQEGQQLGLLQAYEGLHVALLSRYRKANEMGSTTEDLNAFKEINNSWTAESKAIVSSVG